MLLCPCSIALLVSFIWLPPVSITTAEDRNGRQYWVAKQHVKVLWTYEKCRFRGINSHQAGNTVLSIMDSDDGQSKLMVVDRRGRIRSKLLLWSMSSPRMFLRQRCYMVFDNGILAIAYFKPESEGAALEKWLSGVRRVLAYDFHTHKTLWEKSELRVGQPVALHQERLESLCVLNISQCLRHDWLHHAEGEPWYFPVKPRIALVERDIRTGRTLRSARLRLTRTQARDLYSHILGTGSISSVKVTWAKTSARVEATFDGKHFSCVSYR